LAFFEDIAKGVTPTGIVAAAGMALLAPVVAPAISQVLRPAGKAVMRTGITLYRSTLEPISAAIGDLVSEAQLELAAASAGAGGPAEAAGAEATDKPAARPHKRQRAHHDQNGTSSGGVP
jgi:ribosomal protein L12E/L44/L45/RPP1/RPP2